MNTDQLAAEAADEIWSLFWNIDHDQNKSDIQAIIKSAIEKAWDDGYVEGTKNERKLTKRIADAVSRAVHASAVSKAMDDVPFGDEQEADQQRAREARASECNTDTAYSGVCIRGTKACNVIHPEANTKQVNASEQEKFPRIQDTPEFKRGMEKADRAAKEKGNMSELFSNVNGKLVPRDVCARKHGGNEQSKAAFQSCRITDAQRSVWINIYDCRGRGVTCDELAERMGTTPNAISGRITELRIKGKIEKRGVRKTRSGCNAAVWVAI